MDNGRAVKILGLGVAGIMLLLSAQSSTDPADLLEQARDKLIARVPPLGYACTATIDRSYFRRQAPQLIPQACEQMSADRKKTQNELELQKTDRLRLQVELTTVGEIYSWTGPGGFRRKVDELVQPGNIGTGELGGHLKAIFTNPVVRFRLLGQNGKNFEFGFRVPVEASRYVVKAGTKWSEMGYDGSLMIDTESLELKRVTIETDELQAESGICESSTTLEYPPGGEGVLLPSTARTHHLNHDTTETDWDTKFSECGEAHEQVVERQPPALLPSTWAVQFKLAVTAPIDTSMAAAGDVVHARLLESIIGPSGEVAAPAGAMLTGRILRMEHYLHKLEYKTPGSIVVTSGGRYFFLIWIDFDRVEARGGVSSIRARLMCGEPLDHEHPCPFATMSDQTWDRALAFGKNSVDGNVVVPAGYTSTWVTGDPSAK